jgi:hypothetical protein
MRRFGNSARRSLPSLLIAAAAAACTGNAAGPQGELAGMSWIQGQVFVCNTPGHCTRMNYPTPNHNGVYVDLIPRHGTAHGGGAVNNDGSFGDYVVPGQYLATLRPARLYGMGANSVRVHLAADGRTAFNLAYGHLK